MVSWIKDGGAACKCNGAKATLSRGEGGLGTINFVLSMVEGARLFPLQPATCTLGTKSSR